MESIISFFIQRLNEPSTWRGLIWLVTALGLALSPEQKESIVTTGMAVAGLIGVFTKDKSKPTQEQIEHVENMIQEKVDEVVLKAGEIQNENPSANNFFND